MTEDSEPKKGARPNQDATPERRLAVVLEGGLVQAVVTDHPSLLGIEVMIIDYDTEGAESPVPVPQPDGGTAYGAVGFAGVCRTDIDLQAVADFIAAADEREAGKVPYEVTFIASRTVTEICKARVKAESEEEARRAARELLEAGKLDCRAREESDATVEFKKIERLEP